MWLLLLIPLNSAPQTREEAETAKGRLEAVQTVDGTDLTATEAAVIQRLNAFRVKQGRAPLVVSSMRQDSARRYTAWMAANRTFQHSPEVMARNSVIGENIARGELGAQEVIQDWINSPGHRRTMLRPWRSVGVGCYQDRNQVWYWTLQFEP